MNRFRSLTAATLIAGIVATGVASAQGPGGRRGGPRGFGAGLALNQLELTDAQQGQVRDIRQRHGSAVRTAEERVRAALEAQRSAIESPSVNEGLIRSTTQQLAEAQTASALEQARVFSEIWAVLTPAQQEEATRLKAQRATRSQEQRERTQQRLRQRRG